VVWYVDINRFDRIGMLSHTRLGIVFHVVIMSYSRLHLVIDMFTSGKCIGGAINRVSRCCRKLNCLLMNTLKCLFCCDW
jgi:hypothetical protein